MREGAADIRERSLSRHSNHGRASFCSYSPQRRDRWCLSSTTLSGSPRQRSTCELRCFPLANISWRQVIDGPVPLNHVVLVTMTRCPSSNSPPASVLFSASSRTLEVKRLTEEGVVAYIDTCLNGRVAASGHAIASFLYGETGGSPLFLRTLMATLLKEQVVAFDFDSLQWRFDLVTLQSHLSDANFDSYLENVMRRLPPDAQELLKVRVYIALVMMLTSALVLSPISWFPSEQVVPGSRETGARPGESHAGVLCHWSFGSAARSLPVHS